MFWIQLALGLLVAGALSLVLAELGVRAWLRLRGRYYIWAPFLRSHMELDSEGFPMLPKDVRIEINGDGERGPECANPHDYRVLIAGGSAAEGYYLDQDAGLAAVLQRELEQPEQLSELGSKSVHVGNVARSLVKCEYIQWMLAKTLPRYERLDAIFFMVGASDMVAWLEKGCPASIEAGKLEASRAFQMHPEGPFTWRPAGLALRRLASYWNTRLRRPIERRTRTGKTLVKVRAMRAAASHWIDQVDDAAPMLRHFEESFRTMVESAKKHATRVVVIPQPWFGIPKTDEERAVFWNFGRGRPYQDQIDTYYTHRLIDELMGKLHARQSELARELGVEVLDVQGDLKHDLSHFYDYLHFTPVGAEVVGRRMAEVLVQDKQAPEPSPPAVLGKKAQGQVTR